MRLRLSRLVILAMVLSTSGSVEAQGAKPLTKCAPDAVLSGTVCMDRFEASVWRVPDPLGANKGLVRKIQQGKATTALLAKGGAVLIVGTVLDPYAPCTVIGEGCADVFAVSLPGVEPGRRISWFQAQQACKNARKRLPSNAEWQAAVAGTPDPGPDNGTTDCNTSAVGDPILTGSRSACVSADGAVDMVGNVAEWVADWLRRAAAAPCNAWITSPTGDQLCLGDADPIAEPAAFARGNDYAEGALGGPLALWANFEVTSRDTSIGFRCAR
jgi:hypothetical protein